MIFLQLTSDPDPGTVENPAACADAIVSWNFKHIVRLDKMKYQRVNLQQGYGLIPPLCSVDPRLPGPREGSEGAERRRLFLVAMADDEESPARGEALDADLRQPAC